MKIAIHAQKMTLAFVFLENTSSKMLAKTNVQMAIFPKIKSAFLVTLLA